MPLAHAYLSHITCRPLVDKATAPRPVPLGRTLHGIPPVGQGCRPVTTCRAESVRAGDFVFWLSESRFAIVVVEVEQAQAETIARALQDHVGAVLVRAGSQALRPKASP